MQYMEKTNHKSGCRSWSLIAGANANNGTNAGLSYLNSSNAFSNSNRNNGSRLNFKSTSLLSDVSDGRTVTESSPLGGKRLRPDGASRSATMRTLHVGIKEANHYAKGKEMRHA